MMEISASKAALILGIQLPLFIVVTAWLARRDGVQINWWRIAAIALSVLTVLVCVLYAVGSKTEVDSETTIVAVLGTIFMCLGLLWAMTRNTRKIRKTEQEAG
jgi:positive regulator of sigma E activity